MHFDLRCESGTCVKIYICLLCIYSQNHKELEKKYAMEMEHNEVLEASINLCRQVIDKVSINLLVGLFTMRNFFTAMSTLTQCRDY